MPVWCGASFASCGVGQRAAWWRLAAGGRASALRLSCSCLLPAARPSQVYNIGRPVMTTAAPHRTIYIPVLP